MDERLQNAIQQAAEIAKQVPDNLQQAAFNRALDEILGQRSSESESRASVVGRSSGGRAGGAQPEGPRNDGLTDLLARIDRTKYPDIGATSRVADQALKVLQLVNDDLGIDGLTAQDIAAILARKFRQPVAPNAVNMALERETGTVDIRTRDGAKRFHLMAPGEEYLKRLRDGKVVGVRRPRSSKAARRTGKEIVEPAVSADRTLESSTTKSVRRSPSRPGPKAAVEQLLSAGFFNTPRSISTIQDELRHKRGHLYTLQDLSPTLVRLLRGDKLSRERNGAGQYEYKQK